MNAQAIRQHAVQIAALLLVSLAGCSVHASVSFSKGQLDPAGEARYRTIWQQDWTLVNQATPGLSACNIGGAKQACYDASAAMARALRKFTSDLQGVITPSRYAAADAEIKTALAALISGYERRNEGIAHNVDADFVAGNDMLKQGTALLRTAYGKFPADARPMPAVG